MEFLESERSREWAARALAGVNVRPRWLVAVLKLSRNAVSLCYLFKTGKRPLLTRCDAEAQTGHKGFVVRDRG